METPDERGTPAQGNEQQIELDNGWLVDIVADEEGEYTIIKIRAMFGYGIYHHIDIEALRANEWSVYHKALRGKVAK